MKDHNNLKEITRSLLKEIGEDPNRDGLLKTPERVAKAWDFFSQGYDTDIQSIVNDAIFEEDCSEMVVVRDIEFFSMCEHHLIPFFGRCHVGYLPNKKDHRTLQDSTHCRCICPAVTGSGKANRSGCRNIDGYS